MAPERLAVGTVSAHRVDKAIEVSRVGEGTAAGRHRRDILQGVSEDVCQGEPPLTHLLFRLPSATVIIMFLPDTIAASMASQVALSHPMTVVSVCANHSCPVGLFPFRMFTPTRFF